LKKQRMKKSYIDDYNNVQTKEEFVRLLLVKYSDITKETANREYYRVRQKLKQMYIPTISKSINSPLKWKYNIREKSTPHPLKIIIVKDMIRFGIKIDRKYLQKHGLNNMEINWLEDEGLINLKED